ncbi:nuclear transcription factor Y subunit C-3-like [Neltuma alba]|uniref:nuclear transcription factor Y subunit C-3-like n=1 Tax=Neltuma alba TaxID=207710 RepID=UPI0010A45F87|nr:nuclear transcription factor Y subunit C-3-like [Prosopis alba]XP_028761071.1 nuclear transcription factor Y subunit C-3-like [Prosopis alba]XP_028761072.1 nuclear transcription factor Y subunit C-3-like [Prosopis alba]XP_028761073.1 nuclear transcription factor Y subunit C-3-like [Prosopis alba]XP_028761074.1 nuclear transcription factor Y subunit C-3-like [Prosopis alba]XP_028795188.1 nuclear transcription factor Y subunit C-3-like [Prosopis alba]XP_028795189.1 nuclear transcription fact
MDQNQHGLAAGGGMSGVSAQGAYGMNQYQPNPMMAAPQTQTQSQSPSQAASGLPASSSSFLREQQYAHQYMHQLQQQELRQQLQNFWTNQYHEIEQIADFKNHSLPLARIKKIMKADEDVRMISAEAPVIFARACEMFILELTLRSWINAEENKRRTLQKNDIAAAITKTDVFDFLVDIVPRDDLKDEMLPGVPRVPAAAENVPYYYMPPQQVVGPPPPHSPHSPYGAPKVIMGRPVVDQTDYGQPPHPSFSAQVWPYHQNPPSNNNSDS